jgi:hypothetical protein
MEEFRCFLTEDFLSVVVLVVEVDVGRKSNSRTGGTPYFIDLKLANNFESCKFKATNFKFTTINKILLRRRKMTNN